MWEIAIASAGAILSIHPFNQPDVELAKRLAKEMLGRTGEGISLSVEAALTPLRRLLSTVKEGDYICLQAYLPEGESHDLLQEIRLCLRDRFRVATTLGYGPRFLHSTGQLHKGGPNTGVFIQIVDEPQEALPIPEEEYTFDQLIRAQAWGDYRAMQERGRRAISLNVRRPDRLKDLLDTIRSL